MYSYLQDVPREFRHGSRALITAPTADVMTLANCKAALGITGTDKDAVLTPALAAVVNQLDPASGGWLGRALRPQTWELRLPSFSEHEHHHRHYTQHAIALPFPKLISVVNVKYDDPSGVEQTLIQGTDFRVLGIGTHGKQAIAPLYLKYWPLARWDAESVRIRFQSGYAPAIAADPQHVPPIVAVADEMPSAITEAIALGVRLILSNAANNLYVSLDRVEGVSEKRYIVSAAVNELVRSTMMDLLSTYRVFG
jgi:hypothetical protein